MQMLVKSFFLSLCLVLSGCIGSEILERDVDLDKPYPLLHSVPELPPKEDFASYSQALKKQEQSHQNLMEQNKELRKLYEKELK